jgi:nucleoside-diphosphate-sugar epimerase
MNILVTGGFGNVGRSAVNACLAAGHKVAVFESPSALKRAQTSLRRLLRARSPEDVGRAFAAFEGGPDAVIHLAALIPPASDRNPAITEAINVGGTSAVIAAAKACSKPPRVVLASSIAIYGDRLADFWINASDAVHGTDTYSGTKVACEGLLRASGIDFAILRLSFVAWAKWLPLDPLLFSVPPETRLEIIHTEDAGRAFAAAAALPAASGRTFDIGGGALCRTSFRAYIDRMFRYFGLGDSSFLPESAFAAGGFHRGWYEDSDEAERLLGFRRKTLEDYYEEVRWETRFIRPLAALAAPAVRLWLLKMSPFSPRESRTRPHREGGSSPARLRPSTQERR